jgi:hypothetical protein
VFAQIPDRLGNAAHVSSRSQEMAEPRALPSRQQPVHDLSDDEWRKHLAIIRRFEQPD